MYLGHVFYVPHPPSIQLSATPLRATKFFSLSSFSFLSFFWSNRMSTCWFSISFSVNTRQHLHTLSSIRISNEKCVQPSPPQLQQTQSVRIYIRKIHDTPSHIERRCVAHYNFFNVHKQFEAMAVGVGGVNTGHVLLLLAVLFSFRRVSTLNK